MKAVLVEQLVACPDDIVRGEVNAAILHPENYDREDVRAILRECYQRDMLGNIGQLEAMLDGMPEDTSDLPDDFDDCGPGDWLDDYLYGDD